MKKCPRCNQPSAAKKGGFCSACISWWYRVQMYTPTQLANYWENFELRLRRMDGRRADVRRLASPHGMRRVK